MYKDVDQPPLLQQQNEISTYPSIGDWLRKLWHIYMAQYYVTVCVAW